MEDSLVQFADNLAARSDADARAAIPNPPPMSANYCVDFPKHLNKNSFHQAQYVYMIYFP